MIFDDFKLKKKLKKNRINVWGSKFQFLKTRSLTKK